MDDMNNRIKEIKSTLNMLSKDYPGFAKAFMNFMGEAEKEGALDVKTKELISVALSINSKCEWCIAFHVKNALEAGASNDELMEACFVATLMGGGPSLMYTQLAVKAIKDFSKQ